MSPNFLCGVIQAPGRLGNLTWNCDNFIQNIHCIHMSQYDSCEHKISENMSQLPMFICFWKLPCRGHLRETETERRYFKLSSTREIRKCWRNYTIEGKCLLCRVLLCSILCKVTWTRLLLLGHSGYFGSKHDVNVALMSQIGVFWSLGRHRGCFSSVVFMLTLVSTIGWNFFTLFNSGTLRGVENVKPHRQSGE